MYLSTSSLSLRSESEKKITPHCLATFITRDFFQHAVANWLKLYLLRFLPIMKANHVTATLIQVFGTYFINSDCVDVLGRKRTGILI